MIPAAKFQASRCSLIAMWVLAAALAGGALQAAVDPAPAAATTTATVAEEVIEEVTIIGEAAGPGLWKIRNGDNTLYILGTLSPLPKKMTWRSR